MRPLLALIPFLLAGTAAAQAPLSTADSTLVGRILLAEDRRDSSNAALAEGRQHADERIRRLALRAAARIRDPKFVSRDSFPKLPAPPAYADPAWRLRLRDIATKGSDCAAMRAGLLDSNWTVRLAAADRVAPPCGGDSTVLRILAEWASARPTNAVRTHGGVSWHPTAHALTALARITPVQARMLLPAAAQSRVPHVRLYAARAAGIIADTAALMQFARDPDDNVKETAIDALSRVAGHLADDQYVAALSARGYQAVRAGARALRDSPRGTALLAPLAAAARRIERDSSETSRDARIAIIERANELATAAKPWTAPSGADFDCAVSRATIPIIARGAASAARSGPPCTPLPITLPSDAATLALGRDVRLRVTLADSSGGGSFTVRLRGDVAPIMAARILALARSGYYDSRPWHRVEPDFVIQGGGGGSEYVGYPRFLRDEVGTVPHVRGTVGMSTRGHDTGDAQWFVNLRDNRRLDSDYTVFGEVVDGIEVVDGVLEGDVIARIEVVPPR